MASSTIHAASSILRRVPPRNSRGFPPLSCRTPPIPTLDKPVDFVDC
ncbi:hypothetical protein TIFTF001_052882 [Ficus carica]|uniref:Uncharacterized protein n=1 Tax=Ficus carica TaxID=3494 RepID=A0AA88EDS2_FICCA|nr:hypothetical protein TIFTF001_052882 [Ficus carica]